MKRSCILLTLILLYLLLSPVALAAQTLSAARQADGSISVTWDGSLRGQATLTVRRNGWPVLVAEVSCAQGSYVVPRAYAAGDGVYSVRLKTSEGCLEAVVQGSSSIPEEAQTEAPRPQETPTVRPSSTPAPTPAPRPSGSASSDLASQVVAEVNRERADQGLEPLEVDPDLIAAARVRAEEIVRSFSHTRPDGSSWSTVSKKAYGENIAKGQRTVDRVMAAWMSSSGHRANILRSSFGSIGVCALQVDGVYYWVQLFGK